MGQAKGLVVSVQGLARSIPGGWLCDFLSQALQARSGGESKWGYGSGAEKGR